MKKRLSILAALCAAASLFAAPPAPKPKLVVLVAIDQFRYDYLTRFRSEYRAGFKRLLDQGAVFTNAQYRQFPTVTAVGHSIMLSGAMPAMSGIVGNDWYDRTTGKQVTSVSDPSTKLLGGSGEGSSPHRFLVSTVGDELKRAKAPAQVIGISMKDRSAILPSGHSADGAFWFDHQSGNFVSSTYYFSELPGWVDEFNRSRVADQWLGKPWVAETGGATLDTMPANKGKVYYDTVYRSPFGNELMELFVERAVDAKKLGQGAGTDLLTVSFSSNDAVGHQKGPDSPEVHDMCVKTDRTLGRLLDFFDRKVGPGRFLLVLTADHGVAPMPEENRSRKMPGGRFTEADATKAAELALDSAFGHQNWIAGKIGGTALYLDRNLIKSKGLSLQAVEQVAASALRALPYIARVYTSTDLLTTVPANDFISRNVLNGFFEPRSPDLILIPLPYWIPSAKETSHFTPYNYDTHVPIVFYGTAIHPSRIDDSVMVNDIAPTISAVLEIEPPAGNSGRVLTELFR